MPFESPATESAPTRRSRRLPTAGAPETPETSQDQQLETPAAVAAPAPLTRRSRRQDATSASPSAPQLDAVDGVAAAQTLIAASALAAVQAVSDPSDEPKAAPSATSERSDDAPTTRTRARAAARPTVTVTPVAAPVSEPATVPTPVVEDAPATAPQVEYDVFAAASQLFASAAPEPAGPSLPRHRPASADQAATSEHVVPQRPRVGALRKMVTLGASAGVMGIAGLLAVSMTLPAEAVAAAQGASLASTTSLVAQGPSAGSSKTEQGEIQAFVAPTAVQNEALTGAAGFSTISRADLAAEQGIRYSDSLYTNDPNASIQWPFVVGVAMSSPYGPRWGQLHAGIDLVPGEGAPIQAIADGVVRLATESDGGYGVGTYIDHVIDGQVITSHYAHMQYGSQRLQTGDVVKVGDIVGLTGNTGRSYGAHLHFELIVNGSTIDPLPWMMANAGRK